MARRNRSSKRGLFTRLYSPIGHLLSASKESVGAVTNTAKGVVGQGLGGLNKIGRSVTSHANMAVRDLVSRKNRRSSTRRNRRSSTRKNRRH